jgi:hypothetical protein
MASRADFRDAASEHLKAGILCHDHGGYISAHYLFGLAVECILQAHGGIKDRSHNIQRQYSSSTFESIIPADERWPISLALNEIELRWRNRERYDSPRSLTKKLNDRGASYNKKGDKLKQSSATMKDAARAIVNLGVRTWS